VTAVHRWLPSAAPSVQGQIVVGMISDTEPHEDALWNNALTSLKNDGIKKALDILFSASCSVSSVRSKNRYRLLMAKLCLQADRHDLARPIAEELNTLVEELGLERWESPVWVADVLGACIGA
jgi:type VI secretion system protein ImpA